VIGIQHRLRTAALGALVVVTAALAAVQASPSAAAAAPSPAGPQSSLVPLPKPPKPPAGHDKAKLLFKTQKKVTRNGVAEAAYVYCYVDVSNAYLYSPGVRVDVLVYCVDDYGFYAAVDEIDVDLTIFESNQPVKSASGVGFYTPYVGGGLVTDYCTPGAYYYGEAFVVVYLGVEYDYGAFGSPVSIPVC
jgi:hypothetical protein